MPELPNLKRELKSRSWPKVFGLAGAGERQLLFICHESFRIPNLKPFAFRMGQAVWDGGGKFPSGIHQLSARYDYVWHWDGLSKAINTLRWVSRDALWLIRQTFFGFSICINCWRSSHSPLHQPLRPSALKNLIFNYCWLCFSDGFSREAAAFHVCLYSICACWCFSF